MSADNSPAERDLRVIFAGGGTGGHIMPGAATAEALRAMFPKARSLFLVTPRRAERCFRWAIADFEVATIPAARWQGALQKLRFAATAVAVAERSLDVIRQFRAHVVVGLGGYSSVVPVLVARALAVPTMVFESNAVPGRVVRMLAPLVDCVQLQWEDAALDLKARRVLVSGNPERARIFAGERQAARRRFGLEPDRFTLLVVGGSQGALPLNRLLAAALWRLSLPPDRSLAQALQVLHLTGPDHIEEALWASAPRDILYRPIGFLEEMQDAYAVADLVLARAGGSTLAQITALGLPSVLVPYPHATDDHQSANAAVLARAGAAVAVAQADLSPEKLAGIIAGLVQQPERLAGMASAARALGRPDAARVVAACLAAMAGLRLQASSITGVGIGLEHSVRCESRKAA